MENPLYTSQIPANLGEQDLYSYVIDVVVTAGTQEIVTVDIESNSDFVWTQTVSSITGDTLVDADPAILVLIEDGGSGRKLQQKAVNISLMSGTGSLPHTLPMARKFVANTSVQVTVTNNEASTQTMQIVLQGFKVWKTIQMA